MVQLNTAVQIGCLDAIYIHVLFKVFHVQFHTQMFDLKEIYSATTAEYSINRNNMKLVKSVSRYRWFVQGSMPRGMAWRHA